MFAQRIRQIGLTVAAAAFIATTLATAIPAAAAPIAPSQEDAMVAKPDVAVTIANVNNNPDLSWDILYNVSNVGTADSGPIAVKIECVASAFDDYKFVLHSAFVTQGLKAKKSTAFAVHCDYAGVRITVGTANDANLGNNSVSI